MGLSITLPSGARIRIFIPLPPESPSESWVWVEILVTLALVQTGLWTLGPTRAKTAFAAMAWIALTTLWDKSSPQEMGLTLKEFRKSLWLMEPVILAVSLIWLTGYALGTAHETQAPEAFLERKAGYLAGALLQQFVMQSYVYVRLRKLVGNKASLLTALFFALTHLPNPVLMVIALAGGWVSSTIFKHQRSLIPLGLAHGLIGASLSEFWPSWVMRAGIGAFRWYCS